MARYWGDGDRGIRHVRDYGDLMKRDRSFSGDRRQNRSKGGQYVPAQSAILADLLSYAIAVNSVEAGSPALAEQAPGKGEEYDLLGVPIGAYRKPYNISLVSRYNSLGVL